jgi:CpeT protein
MINKFCEWFEGEFNNQRQAFENPTRFAMIELFHERIEETKFHVRQQYMVDHIPYRESIIQVVELDEQTLILKNSRKDLTELLTCDIMLTYSNNEFAGGSVGNECMVDWNGKQTYLTTQCILSEGIYRVVDKGISLDDNTQIWGSENGFFEFRKQSPDQFKVPL